MSYWNAVYLLALLLLQECCLSVCVFLNASSRLLNPREIEKPYRWPVCYINNTWSPCPNDPMYQRTAITASPDNRSKRYAFQQFQLPFSLNLPVSLPNFVGQKLKRPVSMATRMLNPRNGVQTYNWEFINNNNSYKQYYHKPHIADFSQSTNEKVPYPISDLSHNLLPVTRDLKDYYKNLLHSFHTSSSGANNFNPVTLAAPNFATDHSPRSQNMVRRTTNAEPNFENTLPTSQSVTGISGSTSYEYSSPISQEITTPKAAVDETEEKKNTPLKKFAHALHHMDRVFYTTTFEKLLSISPPERSENGISFVQSGLFLSLMLMALSATTDDVTASEIDEALGIDFTNEDKSDITREIIRTLPEPTDDLRWHWSSRLVVGPSGTRSMANNSVAEALQMNVAQCNETDPEALANALNEMVLEDSGGAIRDTFEAEEMEDGFRAAAVTTLYFRGRWRSAPTVLNGTRPFRDEPGTPERTMRMIRINDLMRYASMDDWGCQAIEISYATPGLTLLILVPDKTSLRGLAKHLGDAGVPEVTRRLEPIRAAVSMPLYTLRMTLLLPSKLQSMGINRLVDWNNTESDLRLSHAVQRIMFWAEPGRNAFKDDGIEWDRTPELELVVDRPYLFFVRWYNLTLMNGNFVL